MRSVSSSRSGMSCSGMLTLARILPVANSITDGMPMPTARVSGVTEPSIAAASCSTSASCEACSVGTIARLRELAALEHGDGDLGAADVDADELIAHASSLAAAGSQQHEQLARARAHVRRGRRRDRAGRRTRASTAFALSLPVTRKTTRRAPFERRQRQRDARDLRLHARELDARHQPLALLDLGLAREQRRAVRVRPEPEQHAGPSAASPPRCSRTQRLVVGRAGVRPELALHPHAPRAAGPSADRPSSASSAMRKFDSPLSGGTQRSSLNQTVAPLQLAPGARGHLVGAASASSRRSARCARPALRGLDQHLGDRRRRVLLHSDLHVRPPSPRPIAARDDRWDRAAAPGGRPRRGCRPRRARRP